MKNNHLDKIALVNWLLWVKKASPTLYALFKVKYPHIIEAINDKRLGFSFDWGAIGNVATKFVETALPIYAQQKQFKQQLELAKIQALAPAGFQQPVAAQTPVYQSVAVPPAVPTTNVRPTTTPNGQQILEIRIDKSQIEEVKKAEPNFDLKEYLPYIGISLVLFSLITRK